VRRYNGSNNNGNNQPNDGEAWRVNGNGNGNGNSSGTMTTADSDSTMEEQSTAQHGLKATTATTTKRRNGATINQMERHEGGAPWSTATSTAWLSSLSTERGIASAVSNYWNLIL
jgi:hypothetical protein